METENYYDFDKLTITTMTLIFKLDCVIDLKKAFFLLPITKIENRETGTKYRTRYKIPHYKEGSILSMRYLGSTRGILKTLTKKYFKNSVTIDVSLKEKNVNIKMCASKFHMCGAKNMSQGYEGANLILNKIKEVSEILDRVNKNEELKMKTIEMLLSKVNKNKSKENQLIWKFTPQNVDKESGINNNIFMKISNDIMNKVSTLNADKSIISKLSDEYCEKYFEGETVIVNDNMDMEHPMTKKDYVEKWLTESLVLLEKIEISELNEKEKESIDYDYYKLLLQDIDERSSMDYLLARINIIKNITSLYEGNLSIVDVNKAMVNFNYSLGCEIDRHQLKTLINQYDGFYAQFDNSIVHYVTIKSPYECDDAKKKRNKKSCHSFLVYKSGLVTQSGPNEQLMKEAYKKFMDIFQEIKDQVKIESE